MLRAISSWSEIVVVKQVRAFMDNKVAPIINKYWVEDAFPFELLPAFKELNIGGPFPIRPSSARRFPPSRTSTVLSLTYCLPPKLQSAPTTSTKRDTLELRVIPL
jgi:hypothetical protein